MIGTILVILGIAALSFFCFALGAVCAMFGAYEKIKTEEGTIAAKEWLGKMRDKSYGR